MQYKGEQTKNKFAFRYYNPKEEVLGKPMREHLRFTIAYWHTIMVDSSDPFGAGAYQRDWKGGNPVGAAKNRMEAFFEILEKSGTKYFCFRGVDIAPQGDSLEESFQNISTTTDLIKGKMDQVGIKLLWNTANMLTRPHSVNGAVTTNNADAYAIAAAQIKEGLGISKKLNGQNYVFWGGRGGYESLLNTNMDLELDNLARFYRMAITYTKKIGHRPQFLVEPKPKEPSKHQYDPDTATSMAFIVKHSLRDHFKLNLEANHATLAGHTFKHEISVARNYNALGSLDTNQGDLSLGWDTGEFPTDIHSTTLAVYKVLGDGGIAPGGINFDVKVRRTSFEMGDLILAHIAGVDTCARGLCAAAKMRGGRFFEEVMEEEYTSFTQGTDKKIIDGQETFESLNEYALSLSDVTNQSSHIEYVKSLINDYLV